MQNAKILDNRVVFCGNHIGFISCGTATLDQMFRSEELEVWLQGKGLKVLWKEGIYLRLVDTSRNFTDDGKKSIKTVRIWRLNQDFPVEGRFMFLDDMRMNYGEPSIQNYSPIFQEEMGTDNLETIYSTLAEKEYSSDFAYPLSVSDVIELFDEKSREFYFISRYRFEPVNFLNSQR